MIETLSHFSIHSKWTIQEPVHLMSRNKIYEMNLLSPDEGGTWYPNLPGSLSYKFSQDCLIAPIAHLVKVVLQVVVSLGRFLSLYSVWSVPGGWKEGRSWASWGEDGLRIILSPIFYLGFVFLSWYGIHRPMDGTHARATLEEAFYVNKFRNSTFHPILREENSLLPPGLFGKDVKINICTQECNDPKQWVDRSSQPVTLSDFHPWSNWQRAQIPNRNGIEFVQRGGEGHWYGGSTGAGEVRFKFFILMTYGLAIQSIVLVANGVLRALYLLSGSHFWAERPGDDGYQLGRRFLEAGKDLLRIVGVPVGLVAFAIVSLFGLLFPYDARHLYATFERTFYGEGCRDFGDGFLIFGAGAVLAPCMQPLPFPPAGARECSELQPLSHCCTCI